MKVAQILIGGLLIGLLVAAGMAQAQAPESYGVVSMRITVQKFDPGAPWNKTPERVILGNAMVVGDNMLLTTADLVKNATLIEVRKFGRYPDYQARAQLVDYELDLALLKVDSKEFWKGLKPMPFAESPIISGRFVINRWRSNGRFEQGSGEVVQLHVATSRFGDLEFPELEATTAMSALGWGEVLTSEGRIIGIVTSHNNSNISASNSTMLKRFIAASRQKPYRGVAHRGFYWQQLNQADLRDFFGLNGNVAGVLVRRLLGGGTGSKLLRKGDILLRLGSYRIDPEGRISHPLYGPILFTIAINETLEPTIPAEILRDGKRREIMLERRAFEEKDYRVHPYIFDRRFDYEMFGGLVVQELSLEYLRLWGKDWREKAPTRLVMEYSLKNLKEPGIDPEKVVFVSKILPDPVNVGYEGASNSILLDVNGTRLRSLADFRRAIRKPEGAYHVLEFNPANGRGKVVFMVEEVKAANRRIRERYGVPSQQAGIITAGQAR